MMYVIKKTDSAQMPWCIVEFVLTAGGYVESIAGNVLLFSNFGDAVRAVEALRLQQKQIHRR